LRDQGVDGEDLPKLKWQCYRPNWWLRIIRQMELVARGCESLYKMLWEQVM